MQDILGQELPRQKRITTFFMECASQIIREKGVAGVTIRGVAELAGYTSATLYNYFDNLNHLVFLATMDRLEEYYAAVPRCIAACNDPVEVYLAACECFCRYSFRTPDIYEVLMFSGQDKQRDYTAQYFRLFPEKADVSSLHRLIPVNYMEACCPRLLEDCVGAGVMTAENAKDLGQVATMVYKCVLMDVKEGRTGREEAVAKTMGLYRQLLKCYTKPCCAG